jgi:aspartyl-tRNA(Asn)/glutamyl-tRNA(Gln) amidotransferase subunit A
LTDSTGADLSLEEASRAIRDKGLSPVELLDSCIDRLERVEGTVKAFTALDLDRARREASELTEELQRRGPRSPLHGMPMGVKDMVDVEGFPTRAGSRVLGDAPVKRDASVVKRLRDAGAVIIGKTTTHEFAIGIRTPPTRNPWDPDHIPGGSSGGSAAAVAAGECLAALGTDSGGSIRIPAAFCGVSGLRPRAGSTPTEGVIPLSWTHDTSGPIARTAVDLGLAWRVIGADPTADWNLSVESMRIGVLSPLQTILGAESEIEESTRLAAKVLESEGARLRDVSLTPFTEWDGPRKAVVASDMLALHRESGWYPLRAELYSEETLAFLRKAEQIGGADLVLARRKLSRLGEEFTRLFDDVDVVVMPTVTRTAPTVDEAAPRPRSSSESFGSGFTDPRPLVAEVLRATGPIGWCGLVSVSVPSGLASDGLPLGVQFVARDESTALSVAARYQTATDFHEATPPLSRIPVDQS